MLIAEEPELFLHPQARRVISAELDKYLLGSEQQERQLIISTHSTEYLKNVEPINITRVYKDSDLNCSIAKQLDENTSRLITLELKRFLWSNNSEIFFADKVILVEGGEVFLLPAVVDNFTGVNQQLDYDNITVARVNGKGSFLTYAKMLDCFHISYLILGDLDCFRDEVNKLVAYLKLDGIKTMCEKIKGSLTKMDIDYSAIQGRIKDITKNNDAQQLKELFEGLANGVIEKNDERLQSLINYMQSRFTKGEKQQIIIDAITKDEFEKVLKTLKDNNVFVWSKGELESYFSDKLKEMPGSKDMKPLLLSYLLQNDNSSIDEYLLYPDEIKELCTYILKK